MLMRLGLLLLVGLIGLMGYIRLAPARADDLNNLPSTNGIGDTQRPGGFMTARQIAAPAQTVLQAVAQVASAAPRTRLVAGSVQDGMMTFVTRSALWGFPDYTTAAVQGDILVISGHLRFGRSDMGVNKSRILGWLAQLAPLTVPL